MTNPNTCHYCGVGVGEPHTNECKVRQSSAEKSIADRYREWCCDNGSFETLGKYGPEFRIRIDVPLADIVDMMRDADIEPTIEHIHLVLSLMQANHFDDAHGGCPSDDVKGHILETADTLIESCLDDELFDDC